MKLGLCLSGGGIKGFAHIGAIRALEEENIDFEYFSGTSSGSIVATLYTAGYSVSEITDIFNKHVKDIKYVDKANVKKLCKRVFKGKGFKIDGLNSGEIIKKLINKYSNAKGIYNIKDIKKPLLIPAVNLCTEELYVFTNYENKKRSVGFKYIYDVDIGTAVQASCSYPGVFSPCTFGKELLVDGGIAENVPWREMKKLGVDKVISIVFISENKCKPDKSILDVVSKSFSILCGELNEYEIDGTDYLVKINLPKMKLLEKVDTNMLIEEGYRQTKKYIKNKL
ncbi:MAG: hypothetical protein HFJ44_01505 [Clostridia bacterium]|jgi:NTE family protein|nr:hypothetical protein [Clostridia bacterium]